MSSQNKPGVGKKADRLGPGDFNACPGVVNDLGQPVDRIGPEREKEGLGLDPQPIEKMDAPFPFHLQRQPQDLRRQPDVARRQRVADSLPSGEGVVLEHLESLAEPCQRFAAEPRRVQQISAQRHDRDDHQSNRR